MRVALVHDWLTGMRGGERCLEVLCELFPDATLYTLLHRRGAMSPAIERMDVRTSFIDRLPAAEARYRWYLPLFPAAVERFDLRDYDLVISTSHCVAKGAVARSPARHLCYLFTPMRYVWDRFDDYFGGDRLPWPARAPVRLAASALRRWDRRSAARVGRFLAISRFVARRVERCYRREAAVLSPPVSLDRFAPGRAEDFYLMVSAFAPYKRLDLALDAFRRLRLPLKVIGQGQDETALRARAGPTVEFLGALDDAAVADHYARCRAFVFPGVEDFGITPLEAQAAGRPVIALAAGGALETVRGATRALPPEAGATGLLFAPQTVDALCGAVSAMERRHARFCPELLRAHAARFGRDRFRRELTAAIDEFRRRS